MSNVVLNILSEFKGKKAFKDADTAVGKLTNGTKKLAGALGLAFGTTAVVNFGKASVKAFMEAEKANTRLANVVDNLGLSFATAGIQKNLDEISAKAGIAGETLIDAFQPLLTTTGSVIKSQELLNLALDVSAGSGTDLTTVTQDLALAYTGVTKGLKKYNLGLSQAELKTLDFNKVQGLLNKQFSGSNSKYLATYAGKMQVLTEAAGNAQEIIGEGLVDALSAIGGNTSIEDLANDMKGLSIYIADVIRGVGNLGKAFKLNGITTDASGNFDPTAIIQAIPILGSYINMLRESGSTRQSTGFSFFGSPMESTQKARDAAAAKKAEADAAKRAKALLDATKKNTTELKKQAALKKQSALFDLEQIGLVAALQGKITDEEKLRLNLQLALLTGNDTLAAKLSQELANSIDKTGNLAKFLTTLPEANNPFKNFEAYLDAIYKNWKSKDWTIPPTNNNPPPTNIGGFNVIQGASTTGVGSTANGDIIINIAGSVTSEEDLVAKIRAGIQSGSLSGKPADIGRLAGMFG